MQFFNTGIYLSHNFRSKQVLNSFSLSKFQFPDHIKISVPSSRTQKPAMAGFESLLLIFMLSIPSTKAWSINYPSPIANLPSLWINNNASIPYNATYGDGTMARAILVRQNPAGFGPSFACGFICNAPCNVFQFALFFISIGGSNNLAFNATASPRVVWTANRLHPVKENASVELTNDGNLVLRDFDGSLVWSTNTSGSHVAGINLAETGNLILFNVVGKMVWESFGYPTDTLLIGQSLQQGKRLSSTSMVSNRTQGQFYLTVLNNGMYAFIDGDPPQSYYQQAFNITEAIVRSRMNISSGAVKNCTTHISFAQGSLSAFLRFNNTDIKFFDISLPYTSSAQFVRLEDDGHLRVYGWTNNSWKPLADVLHVYPDECAYPTVCGQYGICSQGHCSCPSWNSDDDLFHQLDDRQPNLGCSLATPLSCNMIQYHQLLPLPNVTYFSFTYNWTTDEGSCKEACLKACSCKAVFFRYQNASYGSCYLMPKILSLMSYQPEAVGYNLSAYVKVQILPSPSSNSKKINTTAYHVGVPVLVAIICILILIIRRIIAKRAEEDDPFKGVPGVPTRFSYKQLREATNNFSKKLGQGGFGPVYEGKLGNVKIAVKCLRDIGHGKEEFMAEVITIGSIHHINLVRLIGYCSDKFHRLLVYEHMGNGSLDKWLFRRNQTCPLNWATRHRIILDIAKGLAYLHEECRQKIAHLDIKPGNILLDENFNAKISDFGLAKLIDRDQSHVMTKIRGTRGYLAPEWLSSTITEKADIYSFGVVVLEIVSGRKNLDSNQPEGGNNLVHVLQQKIKVGQVLDIVGNNQDEDVKLHGSEMVEVIKLAVWCLQRDCGKRPAMSQVVKVLEGSMDTESTFGSRDDIFDAPSPVSPVPVSVSPAACES